MRSFLSVFLFVLSSNLDTFVIVLAYQINRIRISYLNGLVIGAVTAVFTFAAAVPCPPEKPAASSRPKP